VRWSITAGIKVTTRRPRFSASERWDSTGSVYGTPLLYSLARRSITSVDETALHEVLLWPVVEDDLDIQKIDFKEDRRFDRKITLLQFAVKRMSLNHVLEDFHDTSNQLNKNVSTKLHIDGKSAGTCSGKLSATTPADKRSLRWDYVPHISKFWLVIFEPQKSRVKILIRLWTIGG